MIKNVGKIIRNSIGKINPRYDMCASDVRAIEEMSYNEYDFKVNGFRFGYIQGMKAAKAEMKKGGVANV